MNKSIFIAFILFFVAQTMIWYQTNSQFLSNWAKERPLLIACMGIPISYILIYATKYVVAGFDGLLWPGRLIGFAMGIISFTILTNYYMGEGISTKVIVSLILAVALVCIQVFWK